ncbi:MAG TPA: hypothetical protein VHS58_04210, partial [Acetobacteraceae bacterium]|nr:hypothetical protein [Acetobacteraceae bacterium]
MNGGGSQGGGGGGLFGFHHPGVGGPVDGDDIGLRRQPQQIGDLADAEHAAERTQDAAHAARLGGD